MELELIHMRHWTAAQSWRRQDGHTSLGILKQVAEHIQSGGLGNIEEELGGVSSESSMKQK